MRRVRDVFATHTLPHAPAHIHTDTCYAATHTHTSSFVECMHASLVCVCECNTFAMLQNCILFILFYNSMVPVVHAYVIHLCARARPCRRRCRRRRCSGGWWWSSVFQGIVCVRAPNKVSIPYIARLPYRTHYVRCIELNTLTHTHAVRAKRGRALFTFSVGGTR